MVRVGNVKVTKRCCLSERWDGISPQLDIAVMLLGITQNPSLSTDSRPNVSANLEKGSSVTQVTLEWQMLCLHCIWSLRWKEPHLDILTEQNMDSCTELFVIAVELLLLFLLNVENNLLLSFPKHVLQAGILHCTLQVFFPPIEKINSILSTFLQKSCFLNLLSLCLTFSQAYLCHPWNPDLVTLLYLRPHHFQLNYLTHLMYDFLLNFSQIKTCKSIRLLTDKKHEIHSSPRVIFYCTAVMQNHGGLGGFWTLLQSCRYTRSQVQMSCLVKDRRNIISPYGIILKIFTFPRDSPFSSCMVSHKRGVIWPMKWMLFYE